MLSFHCLCHRLELAVADAVKEVPIWKDVQELMDGLYRFYDNSPLQRRHLKNVGELLGINVLVHPTPKGTRWVAHRERALTAINRNYEANVSQLQACSLDATQRAETRAKARGLRDKL